jgi:hypothetical protein
VCTLCGPEFGKELKACYVCAVIEKALYGLHSSTFAWREDLSTTLETALGFMHCLEDLDVRMPQSIFSIQLYTLMIY